MNKPPMTTKQAVPLERVAKFIRQLTHDVRNGLSAVDLEAAFIAEISTDEEVLAELRKLREMVADTAKMLRNVSLNFQPVTVNRIAWPAITVMEELSKRLESEFPEEFAAVEVVSEFTTETLEIDLNQTLSAIVAVLRNAFQFRKEEGAAVRVWGGTEAGQAMIEVHERKKDFESQVPVAEWGHEPLITTRSGGYGLGLYRARQIAEAQGGSLETRFAGEELVTRMTLPGETK